MCVRLRKLFAAVLTPVHDCESDTVLMLRSQITVAKDDSVWQCKVQKLHESQLGFAFRPSSREVMQGDEIPEALTIRRAVIAACVNRITGWKIAAYDFAVCVSWRRELPRWLRR